MTALSRTILGTSGLVAYWPLDETSGTTIYDRGPNALHGVCTNATNLANIATPNGTKAPLFNGSSWYCEVADNSLLSPHAGASGKMTVECWARPTSASPGSYQAFAGKGAGSGSYEWTIGYSSSGNGKGFFNCEVLAGGGVLLVDTPVWSATTWRHLLATYDKAGNVANLYMDGALVATNTISVTTSDGSSVLRFGYRADASGGYAGHIAHMAIYNRVLTAAEAKDHYNQGMNQAGDLTGPLYTRIMALSPVGYWPLDEANGTTALDVSGNARNGTYMGSPPLGQPVAWGRAPKFDGSTQYVDIADNNVWTPGTTNALSVFALCIPTRLPSVYTQRESVVSKGNSGSAYEWMLAGMTSGGGYNVDCWGMDYYSNAGSGISGSGSPTNSFINNTMFAICGTIDVTAQDGFVYVNGTRYGPDNVANTWATNSGSNTTSNVRIANRQDGGLIWFQGYIGHVAIFPTVLTPDQVNMLTQAAFRTAVATG